MKRHILSILTLVAALALGTTALTSCDDPQETQDMVLDRVLSPTGLSARVSEQTNIVLAWNEMSGADSYEIEAYADSPDYDTRTPDISGTTTATTYTLTNLIGETTYYIRVRSIDAEDESRNSKWMTIERTTDPEQIMEAVATEDVGGTYVTLRWPAGEEAATIEVVPTTDASANTVNYTVTADDIANGYAYIEGLTPETDYTATMYSASGAIRGQRTFTTTIDTGNMTVLHEGATADDLIAAIAADDGRGIFLMDALDLELGDFTIDKSITIAGNPAAISTLRVKIGVATAVSSITLTSLKLDGSATATQDMRGNFLELTDGAGNLGTLTLNSCEITGYEKNFIYNNKDATIGDIVINNCYIHDGFLTGGDGIDLRGGTLASLNVTNTTFANAFRTFLRGQATVSGNITFDHCTFYNLCNNDTGSNNSGLFRITDAKNSTFTVTNSIFYAIGNDQCSGNAGVWARTDGMKVNREVYDGNYWFSSPNLWGKLHADDNASVATEADPQFVDAANGNLTPQDEDMVYYGAGDPRWLK